MKLYSFLLLALVLNINILIANQTVNSLGEIKAETELAQRIENNLSILVEKSLVFVDLELKYNMFNPSVGDLKLDQSLSLPGLPVGKTDSSVPSIDLTDYAPTEITKMNISVRVPQDTDENLLKQIEDVVVKTASINLLDNDELQVIADLPAPKKTSAIFTYRNLVVFLLIFVILLVISNIKNSTKILAKAMRRIKISNLDQLQNSEKAELKSYSNNNSSLENQSFISSSKKPIHIKLLKDDEDQEHTNLDFLNDLTNSNFLSIISEENPQEIALILTQIEPNKVDYFFRFYDGSVDEVITHLVKMENILQLDMKIMVVGMYQKYLEALDKNPLKINNVKTLVNFINNSSLDVAQNLFERLKKIDSRIALEVEKKIFLLHDIVNLKNVQIEQINSEFSHLEMVQFLKCTPLEIRQKFFSQLSERAVIILKEDMEIIGEASEVEANEIINHSLSKIRYILNY